LGTLPPGADDDLHELLTVVRSRQVREVLPKLRERFQVQRDPMLGSVIGELLDPDDKATVRLLLAQGFADALSEAALERLDVDDLRLLLDGTVRMSFGQKDIWNFVARMEPRAHPLLLTALDRRRAEEREKRDEGPLGSREASAWVGVLEPLVL